MNIFGVQIIYYVIFYIMLFIIFILTNKITRIIKRRLFCEFQALFSLFEIFNYTLELFIGTYK